MADIKNSFCEQSVQVYNQELNHIPEVMVKREDDYIKMEPPSPTAVFSPEPYEIHSHDLDKQVKVEVIKPQDAESTNGLELPLASEGEAESQLPDEPFSKRMKLEDHMVVNIPTINIDYPSEKKPLPQHALENLTTHDTSSKCIPTVNVKVEEELDIPMKSESGLLSPVSTHEFCDDRLHESTISVEFEKIKSPPKPEPSMNDIYGKNKIMNCDKRKYTYGSKRNWSPLPKTYASRPAKLKPIDFHWNSDCSSPATSVDSEFRLPFSSSMLDVRLETTDENLVWTPDGNKLRLENKNPVEKTHSEHSTDEILQFDSPLLHKSKSDSAKIPVQDKKRRELGKRDPSTWKANIRKSKIARGEEYLSGKGTVVPAKELKDPCKDNECTRKCKEKFSLEQRLEIFKQYYNLTRREKSIFVLANTVCQTIKVTQATVRKPRENCFKYYLPSKRGQVLVCKTFFLNTLNVSGKTVYYAHKNKKSATVPGDYKKGKHLPDLRRISDDERQKIREHIKSFPHVESHYCRTSTSIRYLDATLNITKMYELYKKNNGETICKLSFYRHIFKTEFNLDFYQGKKALCDKCESFKRSERENLITAEIKTAEELHVREKEAEIEERNSDRVLTDKYTVVLLFDLQNVINLPKSEIGICFYKRKLSVYNLTALAVQKMETRKTSQVYCTMWDETLCGRSGNDIASAFFKILTNLIVDFPEVKYITTWSDGSVPENRNEMIASAAAVFLKEHPQLRKISMKYSVPGHGCLQEVDYVHSQLEKAFNRTDIWSPVGLQSIIITVIRKKPFKIIEMMADDFIDFYRISKNFSYEEIPFSNVSALHFFSPRYDQIVYQTSHKEKKVQLVDLKKHSKATKEVPNAIDCPRSLKELCIPKSKIDDIKSMLKFMPLVDRNYYELTFKL